MSSIAIVKRLVARAYGHPVKVLESGTTRVATQSRALAVWFCHRHLSIPLKKLAEPFGMARPRSAVRRVDDPLNKHLPVRTDYLRPYNVVMQFITDLCFGFDVMLTRPEMIDAWSAIGAMLEVEEKSEFRNQTKINSLKSTRAKLGELVKLHSTWEQQELPTCHICQQSIVDAGTAVEIGNLGGSSAVDMRRGRRLVELNPGGRTVQLCSTACASLYLNAKLGDLS